MKLKLENATFQARLPELLRQHEGKCVLIYQSEVVGIFNSAGAAVKCGYERFQLKPFLVKRVEGPDTPVSSIDPEALRKLLHPQRSRMVRAFVEGVKDL